MTTKEVAQQLDGSTYPVRIPETLVSAAKHDGIVIVYGASDDLMEFEGAVTDEVGSYEGTTVRMTAAGLAPDWDGALSTGSKEALRAYFAAEVGGHEIEALWDTDGYSFKYVTDIPHDTFEVTDEGEKYCKGIVFRLEDCA